MATLFKRAKELSDPSRNQRIEERILVNLAVELTRFDSDGNILVEQTKIEDVTSVGCRFTTQVEFHRGDIVSIQPLVVGQKCFSQVQPQLFEIMWAAPLGRRWTAGARKLEGEKLAGAIFPPANYSPPATSK